MNVDCYKPLKRRKYILFQVYVSSYLLLVRLINCKTQSAVSGKKYTPETKYASSLRRGQNRSVYGLQVGFFFFFWEKYLQVWIDCLKNRLVLAEN